MDITPIVQAVITLFVAILSCFLIPLLREKLSSDQLATIKKWVQIAVNAAEQLYKGSGRGKEKKAYVMKFLESKGFKLDTDSLDNLIESSVLALRKSNSE